MLADDHVMRREMREQLITALTRACPRCIARRCCCATSRDCRPRKRVRSCVKPQTLKSRLHRGRLILRQALAEFAGGVALHTREAVN